MRTIVNFNHKWAFAKGITEAPHRSSRFVEFCEPSPYLECSGRTGRRR